MRPATRVIRLSGREYPIVGPSWRDPRLHLAAVISSVHILGQLGLGFAVSIPQILAAILTCAVIELVFSFWQTGKVVWPASAVLTGSGVALIFRLVGAESGDHWSFDGVHWFALVAGGSLLSKYLIRYRGTHIFNPSNLGLVVAFLLLGSSRAEPLDFWWGPLDVWMVSAYVVIVGGGLFITARLQLLAMALSFWTTLAAAMAVLAAIGHCITARWSFEPVCDWHFWRVIVTSPEVLVFLFFMITDPKTVPRGRVGRIAFGAAVALACTAMIAPQTTEFGAKVALLAGLVLLTATRPLFDQLFPDAGTAEDRLAPFLAWLMGRGSTTKWRSVARGFAVGGLIALVLDGIIIAGLPARNATTAIDATGLPQAVSEIDSASLPVVTVDADIDDLDSGFAGPKAQELALALATALEIEARGLVTTDRELLKAAAAGPRLEELEGRLDSAPTDGLTVALSYSFDTLHLVVTYPFGEQAGAAPGIEARGTMEEVTYGADGGELTRKTSPCALTFALREATDGRWLIVSAEPIES